MITPDGPALPLKVASRHMSGGPAYQQGRPKKGNPDR